jgi:hypothetical protein
MFIIFFFPEKFVMQNMCFMYNINTDIIKFYNLDMEYFL